MTNKFHFDAMRTATQDLPEGSPEWIEGMSLKVQYTFESTEQFGVQPLVESLRAVMPHKPWNYIPKGKPCKRADLYFQGVTGRPWKVLLAMVQEYDPKLALEIQTHVNPGNPGRPKKEQGGNTKNSDNIMNFESPKQGTSQSYTLNRLHRERPDLYEKVVEGELNTNKAAIEAGFRKPKKQVTPEPESVQQFLERHLPGWDIVQRDTGEVPEKVNGKNGNSNQGEVAMRFARMAVAQLEDIQDTHPDRQEAFDYVQSWLDRNRQQEKKQ